MGWGFSFRIFQTFQVQVRAWKVGEAFLPVSGLASPQFESSVVCRRRISEVCPEYVIGFRRLYNGTGLRSSFLVSLREETAMLQCMV
ncbi:hypothetical protein PIB30_076660 [Stylosanthes scabra]|uniref:Uncharacterized protein n=1 Tax=Stylosanthes scabra TaxID=79078 RepID=A0ABU6QQZ2_9FABA|nr:hypothetical protein [Stylosanthes scabra]